MLESSPRDDAGESLRSEYVVVVVVVVVELDKLFDVGCCCCETRTGMTNHNAHRHNERGSGWRLEVIDCVEAATESERSWCLRMNGMVELVVT